MKKIVLGLTLVLSVFILTACAMGASNEPKEKVKAFLEKERDMSMKKSINS